MDNLSLEPMQGRDRPRIVSEAPLSSWMEEACGITFAPAIHPWEIEEEVIAHLNPPLNIQKGTHPFRSEVSGRRSALARACGL